MQRLSCGPVWEFADRNHITRSVLASTMDSTWFFRPRSPTVAPYSPSTDYASDDLRSARLTPWLRPEPCNLPASPAAPRRSAPSCWQARPSPACAALRASICSSQEPCGAPRLLAWSTTALLPMMSRRLSVRSPILDDRAKLLLAAGRSLQRREAEPGGKVATLGEGLGRRGEGGDRGGGRSGRCQGWSSAGVIPHPRGRVARSPCRDRRSCRPARRAGRASLGTWTGPHRGSELAISSSSSRSASIATCDGPLGATQPYSVRWPRIALMSWVRCRTSRSRVRNTRAAACCSSLFTATNRMFGRCAASQIASASIASFFCRFTNGFT